jgi:hypothetical protein
LSITDLFRARWTEQILDEWLRNLMVNRRQHEKIAGIVTPDVLLRWRRRLVAQRWDRSNLC